ncbi:MAG: protein-disulfide reductase DsbD domain-containing protein [Verrucomicrobiota bacterium]
MRHLIIALWLAAIITASAAHTEVKLLLPAAAKTGDTVIVGVELKMESGWHTYWKNPGDSGQATEVKWQLPPGVTAGATQWPLPKKILADELTTYGYENEVVLLVPLKLDKGVPPGPLNLAAKVTWLECKDSCIPASVVINGVLTAGGESKPSADSARFALWQAKVPAAAGSLSAKAWWEPANAEKTRSLNLRWPGKAAGADFFPAAYDNLEIQGAAETLAAPAGEIHLRKTVKKSAGDWPLEISGVFVTADGAIEGRTPISSTPATASYAPPQNTEPLWRMLIYAFIGGLILNIMPCVLPVIALKILGFVNEARNEPRHVRMLGLVYALGVLASFLVLAAVVIGVKAAGHKAGWGMQFGNPVFLVCLITLVTLVALNLYGLFEVTLYGGAMNTASNLSSRQGAAGAFFNGVLATALATPCTAPFLSIALGFAFAQSAAVILLVFAAVAAGLASPYVLLSWNPSWLKFLPKPGVWMEKFKMAMAFPMMLTVVWLFNLAAESYGERVLWLGVFLVLLAFAAWFFGEFVQRGRKFRFFASVTTLALLVIAYVVVLESQLRWRQPLPPQNAAHLAHDLDGIAWETWSPEALAKARATGRPVLVDFTADWCLTCQVNKRTSIEIPSVAAKIKALNAIALLADYTHFPDAITSELNRYNRAGVPLVLVYPKTPTATAIVLPDVLTPNTILDALDRAAK